MLDAGLVFDPLLPLWLIGAFAATGALLAALAGLRAQGLLRLLGVGFLALALLNPSLQIDETEAEPTIVLLATDRSASQSLGARPLQTDEALANLRARIEGQPNLELREIEVSHDDEGTDLVGNINSALQTLPQNRIGGVIALTDGAVSPGRLTLDEGVPFHRLVTGTEDESDRALRVLETPRFIPVDETASVRAVVEAYGSLETGAVAVEIRAGGEVLARTEVRPNEPFTITLPVRKPGLNRFIMRADAASGELTELNNAIDLEIEGTRDTLRVLLVSGAPHAGQRAWRDILKSDPAVDLVHFTILRPPYKQDATPVDQLALIAFPTYELFVEKLDEFDLIIFDRYQRIGVLPPFYFDNIADYVRRGGALLVASGAEYAGFESIYNSGLADVLPAEPTGELQEGPYHPRLSEVGARHPVTRVLPGAYSEPPLWGRWHRTIPVNIREGRVLMQDEGLRPVLVLSEEGEGRVAQLLSDHAWLWARGVEGGGPYVPLLRRLVHWLMQEPELESERLQYLARGEGALIERQTEGEAVPPLRIVGGGIDREYTMRLETPGQWRADISDLAPGIYSASQGELALDFLRAPDARAEFGNVRSSLEPLASLDAPGVTDRLSSLGADPNVLRVTSGTRMDGRGWIGIRERNAASVVSTASVPLFTGLAGLALAVLALSLIWGLEGGGFLRRHR